MDSRASKGLITCHLGHLLEVRRPSELEAMRLQLLDPFAGKARSILWEEETGNAGFRAPPRDVATSKGHTFSGTAMAVSGLELREAVLNSTAEGRTDVFFGRLMDSPAISGHFCSSKSRRRWLGCRQEGGFDRFRNHEGMAATQSQHEGLGTDPGRCSLVSGGRWKV